MSQQEIASRLKQLRRKKSYVEARDVTQEEVAGATGLSLESFSRYENGKRRVPEDAIGTLARYYGVNPAFIRYGIESAAAGSDAPEAVYGGQISDAEAAAAAEQRRAKLGHQQSQPDAPPDSDDPPTPPIRRAAGDRRPPKNPRDGR